MRTTTAVLATTAGLLMALPVGATADPTTPPAVTKVAPASGPAAGGTKVTVTGTNFTCGVGLNISTNVSFGGVNSAEVLVSSDTSLTAVAPPGAGLVDVQVVSTICGTSPTTPASKFAYVSPTTLTSTGVTTAQFGDGVLAQAKLTTTKGVALVGRTVTFTLAGATATGSTDASGVAAATIQLGTATGTQSLTAGYAGDATTTPATTSTPFSVKAEKTGLTLSAVKSGTARTVTARLMDDDAHPVAAQRLTVFVNGVKRTVLTTDARGTAVFRGAVAGQTVRVSFAGVAGQYLATTAQRKLT
jgi:hypothetical protein